MQGITKKIWKNHILFSHHLALGRKCGKRVEILCRDKDTRLVLAGHGLGYLCKGKIKKHE